MNAQKESLKKTSRVHTSSHNPMKKCAMKMKVLERKKKQRTRKNIIDGRRGFIGRLWKSSMIDCKEPQVDDC